MTLDHFFFEQFSSEMKYYFHLKKARSICFPSWRCLNLAVWPATLNSHPFPSHSTAHSLLYPLNKLFIKEWLTTPTTSSPRQLLMKQCCLLTTELKRRNKQSFFQRLMTRKTLEAAGRQNNSRVSSSGIC